MLLRNNTSPYKNISIWQDALFSAVDRNDLGTLKALIEKGADINVADSRGMTPLHWACQHAWIEIVKVLLAHGAHINAIDNDGYTPLFKTQLQNIHLIKLLLEKGAKLDKFTSDQLLSDVNALNMLLALHIPLPIRNVLLSWAIRRLHVKAIEILLLAGANISESVCEVLDDLDDNVVDAIDIDALIQHGMDINIKDHEGNTLLHAACKHGYLKLVKQFLGRGVNPCAVNNNGDTPMHLACENGYLDIARIVCKLLVSPDNAYNTVLHDFLNNYSPPNPLFFSDLIDEFAYTSTVKPFTLNLSKQPIVDAMFESLPKMLGCNESVAKLILRGNHLSINSLYAIAEALKMNKTLRILDLSSNAMGGSFWVYNSSFDYLLSVLKENVGLVKLILNDCALTPANINALVAFMKQRQHKTLLQIELDDAAIAHLSTKDRKVVLGEKIHEADYLAPPKVKPVPVSVPVSVPVPANAAHLIDAINRIQALLTADYEKLHQSLIAQLENKKNMVLKETPNHPTTELRFFNELASLLESYYHQANVSLPQWKSIQVIVMHAQEAALAKWIQSYDEVKPEDHSDEAKQEAALEAFYMAFILPIQSLYKAAEVINSEHGECSKKTPIENVMDAGKHILFAIPLISESAHAVFHSVHALESTFHALQKFSIIAHVAEFLDEIMEFKKFEEMIKHPKEKLVRLIHGATIEDKLHHLLHCFVSEPEFNSKLKSLSRTIAHHYSAQLVHLSPAYAALWGQYAAVHLIDLFTSGIITHPLTEEELCEQAILWLSHVPLRHSSVPKIKTGEHDISPLEGFTQAGIKFKDRNNKEHSCYVVVKHNHAKQDQQYPIHRNTQIPARWATQKEFAAFIKFWNDQQKFSCTLDKKDGLELIFDLASTQSLQKTDFPLSVEKKSHLSKSKRIKELEKKNVELEKKNVDLEEKLEETKKDLEGKLDAQVKEVVTVKENLKTTVEDVKIIKAELETYKKSQGTSDVTTNTKQEINSSKEEAQTADNEKIYNPNVSSDKSSPSVTKFGKFQNQVQENVLLTPVNQKLENTTPGLELLNTTFL